MIHFDGSKLAEAFSNGGIYVHSDPYLGHRFVGGEIAEGIFTIDYLAPVEFSQDGKTGTISFENIVDPEFAGLAHVVPEGTDSFKNYRTYGSFRYTDHASAELLNMAYGEKHYTYKVQNGGGQAFTGQLTELGDCAVAKNGFSILTGPARGSVAFGDNTVVFQVSVSDSQVLDVVLYPPKYISAHEGDAEPVTAESKTETQGVVDAAKHPSSSEHEPKTNTEADMLPLTVETSNPANAPQEHIMAPDGQRRHLNQSLVPELRQIRTCDSNLLRAKWVKRARTMLLMMDLLRTKAPKATMITRLKSCMMRESLGTLKFLDGLNLFFPRVTTDVPLISFL